MDRTANENISGNWTISSGSIIGSTPAGLVGAGDWQLILWQNFSVTNTKMNFSIPEGYANAYKLDYILWNEGRRCDNNASSMSTPSSFGLQVNNINNGYVNRVMTSNSITQFSAAAFNLTEWGPITSGNQQVAFGSLYFDQIGTKFISVTNIYPFSVPLNETTHSFLGGTIATTTKLSGISLYVTTTNEGGCLAGYGTFNGTVKLYVSKSWNTY